MAKKVNHIIKVKWVPNNDGGSAEFDLEDLGCETIDDWTDLSPEDQTSRLQEALDQLPEQLYMMVESYREKEE